MKAAGRADDRGYAMAALLVAMSVMAVLMSALLPVWSHMATREKEEELIFRGKQYARAIGLFQRKFANTAPPTIDVLVEQRFLRKKYKDPITNDDFQPIYANQQAIQAPGGGPVAARPGQAATLSAPAQQPIQSGVGSTGMGAQGGVIGVTSKSKDESIKIYNGRSRYNEWAFVYIQQVQRPGQMQGVPGGAVPPGGQRGQQGPFGMQPGNMPNMGGRGGFNQPPPGIGQPNRPPLNGPSPFGSPFGNPNGNPNPNGSFTTPNGSTTFTPAVPGQRRPGGGQ
ncbi:MAG: type II secretion system GspH family protein [Cyanobacteria bacterium]|nr:type II secretion system GspH family protein [Cyanobacteriota bacterium]